MKSINNTINKHLNIDINLNFKNIFNFKIARKYIIKYIN